MSQPVSLKDFARLGKAALVGAAGGGPPGTCLGVNYGVSPVVAQAVPSPKGRPRRPHKPGVMNTLESKYAKHLAARQMRGEIVWWGFEVLRFRLADRTWYGPDFALMLPDGSLEFHETKGFMEPQDSVKLKVASELFWMFPVKLVKEKRGIFTVTEVGR